MKFPTMTEVFSSSDDDGVTFDDITKMLDKHGLSGDNGAVGLDAVAIVANRILLVWDQFRQLNVSMTDVKRVTKELFDDVMQLDELVTYSSSGPDGSDDPELTSLETEMFRELTTAFHNMSQSGWIVGYSMHLKQKDFHDYDRYDKMWFNPIRQFLVRKKKLKFKSVA